MKITCVAERYRPGQNSRTGEFFSSLSVQALNDFKSLETQHSYAASEVLFQEKQLPTSILVLIEGDVKLSINSSEGKRLILRIAKPGEILGLTSALSGNSYEMTAETLHSCKIASLRRQDFLGFLLRYPAAYQSLAREMGLDFTRACAQLRTVGLSSSAPAKLARLLIEWCAGGQQTERGTRLKVSLTHEEIGECIGTSRETVTRTLSDFKKCQMVDLQGSTLMISNMVALETYAEL
jgi:CRP/FNR family transcriptional regulator, cyclic AMP receptor protein